MSGKGDGQEQLKSAAVLKDPKLAKRKILVGVKAEEYGDNSIRTSKYKTWNFFFINLFEQFQKPANIYFLVIASDRSC